MPARRPRNRVDVGGERAWLLQNLPPGLPFPRHAGNEDGVWNETGSVAGNHRAAVVLADKFGFAPPQSFFCSESSSPPIVRYLSTQKLKRQLQLHEQQEALANAPASPAICTTSSARISRKWRCLAKWRKWTKIPRQKSNRTRSRFPTPRARRRARSMKLSGRSILPTTRWKASPITPANTRRNISRWPAFALPRRRADAIAGDRPFRRKSATMFFSRSRKPSTTSSNTRTRPKPGFDCACRPKILFWKLKTTGAAWVIGNSKAAQMRNGLRNMKKRMEDIRGEFSIAPGANGGTIVRLTFQLFSQDGHDKHNGRNLQCVQQEIQS
jgi:hypothetical protein